MKMIAGFGEVMIRMSAPNHLTFLQTNQVNWFVGGAEANVLSNLAIWGFGTQMITKLPEHDIGEWVLRQLNQAHISTDYIVRGGDRVGIYYHESGVGSRASKVTYDRLQSSVTALSIKEFNQPNFLSDILWMHISGITPALSPQALQTTLDIMVLCKEKHIPISFDVNYRKKLWSIENARKAFQILLPYIDYLILNEEDLIHVFMADFKETNVMQGIINLSEYKSKLNSLLKQNPNLKAIAVTLRTSMSASYNLWQGLLQTNSGIFQSKRYDLQPIVDRVGSGDAFAAGLILGLIEKQKAQDVIEFATAAGASKHFVVGDFNNTKRQDILSLVAGQGSGRIQR